MAPVHVGAGLAKIRPQANPRGWEKPVRLQTRGCISATASAPMGFGRDSGACGVATYIIKMHKFINLNSQIAHFYK